MGVPCSPHCVLCPIVRQMASSPAVHAHGRGTRDIWKKERRERIADSRLIRLRLISPPLHRRFWELLAETENKAPFCNPFLASVHHTHTHPPAYWQGEDGFCGRSSVTAARSPGGDTSGAAPRIGPACLRWPRINNFSFGAETTGIVIKEMEWFYWPWCLY